MSLLVCLVFCIDGDELFNWYVSLLLMGMHNAWREKIYEEEIVSSLFKFEEFLKFT